VRTLRIGLVYPELLGTYGDGGNAEVLAVRARWRGLAAEIVPVPAGDPVPGGCDLYVVGGGEDEPQQLAAAGLIESPGLRSSLADGAVLLAVCAGVQILGESFPGRSGAIVAGAGLLPVETRRTFSAAGTPVPPRAVGDLAVRPVADPLLTGVPVLLGYENHGGRTAPLAGAGGGPLGTVVAGVGMAVGNGTPDGADGWLVAVGAGIVAATYLHGPVLAQNPLLADALLARASGVGPGELAPLDRPDPALALRAARLRELGLPPDPAPFR
jgi:CobQ-like glutamine amidotransferase family enzyme